VANIADDILDTGVKRQFQRRMEQAIPTDRPGEYNQALMDLGATVCLPNGEPLCESCPLKGICEANRLGIQTQLPLRVKKTKRRVEELTVYLLLRGDRVALRRRPDTGLLAGLWEFPHVPGALDEEQAAKPLENWGLTPLDWKKKLSARHIFTHVEWRMTGYAVQVKGDCPELTWADEEEFEKLAVPSAFAKFLEEVTARWKKV